MAHAHPKNLLQRISADVGEARARQLLRMDSHDGLRASTPAPPPQGPSNGEMINWVRARRRAEAAAASRSRESDRG